MKNIFLKHFVSLGILALMFASCSQDFLEVEPKGTALEGNFYKTEADAYSGLIAVYDVLKKNSGGFNNMITMMNAGSDDHFAGGGGPSDGVGIQAFSRYNMTGVSSQDAGGLWTDHYQGVFRANVLLEKLPGISMDPAKKARFTAETKALRALYYFNLVRMYGNIVFTTTAISTAEYYNVSQSSPSVVYAQIEADLNSAITDLPGTVATTELGRISKGAAQAILGKVYLFEGKNAQAAAMLANVNGTPGAVNQYGNKLLTNFSDLWVVANKFNTESLLEATHSSAGNSDWGWWGAGHDEGNTVNVMCGPRNYVKVGATAEDIPSGWSFNTITPELFNAYTAGDLRLNATVLNMTALQTAGQATYIAGFRDTGYFLNKFTPRRADVRTGGGAAELNYKQNTYVIRLADTYLMEAEALGSGARAQALLDAVRLRAGLPSIPVSLAAIKAERRLELAGEGHRFFDLVRWGDAASKIINRNDNNVGGGFVAGKNEIFPIPYKELIGTKLVQNPGYN